MITIDLNDDYVSTTEKPGNSNQPVAHKSSWSILDRIYQLLTGEHNNLLATAHRERILKKARAGELSIDELRFLEKNNQQSATLAERYTRRGAG